MSNHIEPKIKYPYPLLNPKERILIWRKIEGMWRNRKPEPAKELKKVRKEWGRKLSVE